MIPHEPVLVEQVLEYLQPRPGGRYLDGTLGFGGHALAVLEKTDGRAEILGLDRDQDALNAAMDRLIRAWPEARVIAGNERFSRFPLPMQKLGWEALDGALLDLGVSSHQVDSPERGFSFLRDGPLDMRMDPRGTGLTAREVVNSYPPRQLAKIIGQFGEDPLAGRIARHIDQARRSAPIETTLELARVVEAAYPPARRAKSRNHPATRTFQALRMFVNDEAGELAEFLKQIVPFLVPEGRLVIISFHSLEDRMVKRFFMEQAKACLCPPRQPFCLCGHKTTMRILTKKPVTASSQEVAANPRSRSAKLRAACRVSGT
ncbi:MAG TPA: 16S rRNA (cytosine(1402)-N(4))-methyltransferase RsmH [Desulfonatronum sp.]|nr:16S rRNA (cytosine(1402)-N(4))-methyltransferase RsmH [Desulfonatronum sp.]